MRFPPDRGTMVNDICVEVHLVAAPTDESPQPRVWDRFLTEQDKASLAAGVQRRKGFGEHPALLLIDLYRWVFGDKPEPLPEAQATWPGSCGLAGWNALPHLQRLLAAAREAGIPVIHTTGLGDDTLRPWTRNERAAKNDQGDAEDRLRRRYEFVDEVAPIPGEMVIRKGSASAFW